MRKISRSQRLALTLKVYWRLANVRRAGRIGLRLAMVIILGLAVLAAWNGLYPNLGIAGAMNVNPSGATEQDQTTDKPAISPAQANSLTDSQTPLASNGQTAATSLTTVSVTAATTADLATRTFPGIPGSITSQWIFPMKIKPYTPPAGVFGSDRTRKRIHAAIDLYAPSRTVIYAMTAGRVREISVFYQSLMAIDIENLDGTTIRYGELTPLVEVGDLVSQGQPIAKLRLNYDGTCMLHLEIYATTDAAALTQTENSDDYLYAPADKKSYLRRFDLVDPSAVYSLPRLD